MAVWVAPTMKRRGLGTKDSTKRRALPSRHGRSTMSRSAVLAEQLQSAFASGHVEVPVNAAHELAILEDGEPASQQLGRTQRDTQGHRTLGEHGLANALPGFVRDKGLHQHVDGATAGKTHGDAHGVVDSVALQCRLSALEHTLAELEDVVLDAAATDRAGHLTSASETKSRAGRPWRWTVCVHQGGEGDFFALVLPLVELGKDLSHDH